MPRNLRYDPYRRPESAKKGIVSKIRDFISSSRLFTRRDESDDEENYSSPSEDELNDSMEPQLVASASTPQSDRGYGHLPRQRASLDHRGNMSDGNFSSRALQYHAEGPSHWSQRQTFKFPAPDTQNDILGGPGSYRSAGYGGDSAYLAGSSDVGSAPSGGRLGPKEKVMDFLSKNRDRELSEIEMIGLCSLINECGPSVTQGFNQSFQSAGFPDHELEDDIQSTNPVARNELPEHPLERKPSYQALLPGNREFATSSRRSSHSHVPGSFGTGAENTGGSNVSGSRLVGPGSALYSSTVSRLSPSSSTGATRGSLALSNANSTTRKYGIPSPYRPFDRTAASSFKRTADTEPSASEWPAKKGSISPPSATSTEQASKAPSYSSPTKPLSLTASAVLSIIENEPDSDKTTQKGFATGSQLATGSNPYVKSQQSSAKTSAATTTPATTSTSQPSQFTPLHKTVEKPSDTSISIVKDNIKSPVSDSSSTFGKPFAQTQPAVPTTVAGVKPSAPTSNFKFSLPKKAESVVDKEPSTSAPSRTPDLAHDALPSSDDKPSIDKYKPTVSSGLRNATVASPEDGIRQDQAAWSLENRQNDDRLPEPLKEVKMFDFKIEISDQEKQFDITKIDSTEARKYFQFNLNN